MTYTAEKFKQAGGGFSWAAPPLEIDRGLWELLRADAMPEALRPDDYAGAFSRYGIPAADGFIWHRPGKPWPLFYFVSDTGNGPTRRYFWLGIYFPYPDITGAFYALDHGYRGVKSAKTIPLEDALNAARKNRQTLTRLELRGGVLISSAVLYDPEPEKI